MLKYLTGPSLGPKRRSSLLNLLGSVSVIPALANNLGNYNNAAISKEQIIAVMT